MKSLMKQAIEQICSGHSLDARSQTDRPRSSHVRCMYEYARATPGPICGNLCLEKKKHCEEDEENFRPEFYAKENSHPGCASSGATGQLNSRRRTAQLRTFRRKAQLLSPLHSRSSLASAYVQRSFRRARQAPPNEPSRGEASMHASEVLASETANSSCGQMLFRSQASGHAAQKR